MDTKITLESLNRAYNKQKPENKIIIHSDRGSQYISDIFRNKAKDLCFIQSFNAKGNPYDNAVIESFHAILKKKKSIITNIEIIMMLLWLYFNLLRSGIIEIEYTVELIIWPLTNLKRKQYQYNRKLSYFEYI